MNSFLGILFWFCKEMVVFVGDIYYMLYCFKVIEEYLRYLRFFWYEDSDVDRDFKEYCMYVYIFGNRLFLVVVIYGLKKIVEIFKSIYGVEVLEFICLYQGNIMLLFC